MSCINTNKHQTFPWLQLAQQPTTYTYLRDMMLLSGRLWIYHPVVRSAGVAPAVHCPHFTCTQSKQLGRLIVSFPSVVGCWLKVEGVSQFFFTEGNSAQRGNIMNGCCHSSFNKFLNFHNPMINSVLSLCLVQLIWKEEIVVSVKETFYSSYIWWHHRLNPLI